MLIKSAFSLWAIKVIPPSYSLSTSRGPNGRAGWNANTREITSSLWLGLAKGCSGKGAGSAAALARVARGVWATATHGTKVSKHMATTINRDFIFQSSSSSAHVARRALPSHLCLSSMFLHLPARGKHQNVLWTVTVRICLRLLGRALNTSGLLRAVKLGVLAEALRKKANCC